MGLVEFWVPVVVGVVGVVVGVVGGVIIPIGIQVLNRVNNRMEKFDDRLRGVELKVARLDERTRQFAVPVPATNAFMVPVPSTDTVTVVIGEKRMNATDITHYDIRYRAVARYSAKGALIEPLGEWVIIEGVKGTNAKIEGLKPETTYEVQVRAVNAVGPNPWSESSVVTTKPETSNG